MSISLKFTTIDGGSNWIQGDPGLDQLEAKLAAAPQITVPTITPEGDENGAPHSGSVSLRF